MPAPISRSGYLTTCGFEPELRPVLSAWLRHHVWDFNRLLDDFAGGAAELVCEAARLRDSCILLAGHRPYR